VVAGLMAESPSVSPKYLYGPLGSRLFDAITELPEYYRRARNGGCSKSAVTASRAPPRRRRH